MNPTVDGKILECHNCGSQTHLVRDCPHNKGKGKHKGKGFAGFTGVPGAAAPAPAAPSAAQSGFYAPPAAPQVAHSGVRPAAAHPASAATQSTGPAASL